jgi:hypothetical protein
MAAIQATPYETITKIYSLSGQTDTMSNSLIFLNTGSVPVTIDGVVLQPSQSFSILGNYGEINTKVYSFIFKGNPLVTGRELTVIYKRYISAK